MLAIINFLLSKKVYKTNVMERKKIKSKEFFVRYRRAYVLNKSFESDC